MNALPQLLATLAYTFVFSASVGIAAAIGATAGWHIARRLIKRLARAWAEHRI